MSQTQKRSNEVELSFHVDVIRPQRLQSSTVEDVKGIYKGVKFYTPRQSDRQRKLNENFSKVRGNITNERQIITVTRNDGTDPHNSFYSLHAIQMDDSEDLETSYYTCMTIAIGQTDDGKKINFYVNPMTIAKAMDYCRPENYVYWADIPKHVFDRKNYDQCVDFLVKKNVALDDKALEMLEDKYKPKLFNPDSFYPVMILGQGGFGFTMLMLQRLGKINTTVPYALKFQRVPSPDNPCHEAIKRGAQVEPYFYSRFEHPNILRMFDNFSYVNFIIQSFEYLPYGGFDHFMYSSDDIETLWQYMNRYNKVNQVDPIKLLRFYSAQLLMALEYLDSLDIIHMDFKRDNIGIGYRGYIKIFDFGASYKSREVTIEKNKIETAAYMCKERKEYLLKKPITVTPATDVFAFSILFLQVFGEWYSRHVLNVVKITELVQGNQKKYYEESPKIIQEFIDSNMPYLEQVPDVLEVFKGAYHYDDFQNRMTAHQLLSLDFYNDEYVNKERLFKQKYDLEAELKIDLRDLFVLTCRNVVFRVYNNKNLYNLGKTYAHPKHWKDIKYDPMAGWNILLGGEKSDSEDEYPDDDDFSYFINSMGRSTMKKLQMDVKDPNKSKPKPPPPPQQEAKGKEEPVNCKVN